MDPLTKREIELLTQIAARAVLILGVEDNERRHAHGAFAVILGKVHRDVCPLNLALMLEAPDIDLMHDVIGIRNHLDIQNKRLKDGFLPRCADLGK